MKDKHYHYLVEYVFVKDNENGFGNDIFESEDNAYCETVEKISNANIGTIKKKIIEERQDLQLGEGNIVIISINPLECGCDD